MNINQHEKREVAKLAAAFGPTLIVLGTSGVSGTVADVLIGALGALSTSYALLSGMKNTDKPYEKQHWM